MAMIKFNTNQTCIEFYNAIKDQVEVLQAIKSKDKYSVHVKPKPCGVLRLADNNDMGNTKDDSDEDFDDHDADNENSNNDK